MISGFDFWNETKLGAELKKYIPQKTSRVIIDIRFDDVLRIYCECLPEKDIFNLQWPPILSKLEIINRAERIEQLKSNAKHHESAHDEAVNRNMELIKENAELRNQLELLQQKNDSGK